MNKAIVTKSPEPTSQMTMNTVTKANNNANVVTSGTTVAGVKRTANESNLSTSNGVNKSSKVALPSSSSLSSSGKAQCNQLHSKPLHSNATASVSESVAPISIPSNKAVPIPSTLVSSVRRINGEILQNKLNGTSSDALAGVGVTKSSSPLTKSITPTTINGNKSINAYRAPGPGVVSATGSVGATAPIISSGIGQKNALIRPTNTNQAYNMNTKLKSANNTQTKNIALKGAIPHSQISTLSTSQKEQPLQQHTILAPLNRKNKNLSEKKIRRLEKNRLSARNCRRKKKEFTQNLQSEINILEGENLRLRLQLQIGQEAEQLSKDEQNRVTEGLDALLKSGASDSEIYMNIEDFKEKYADYGRDRRSAIDFHLRNVERLLMPTTTTTVAMRALDGGGGSAGGSGTTSMNGNLGKSVEGSDSNTSAKESAKLAIAHTSKNILSTNETTNNEICGLNVSTAIKSETILTDDGKTQNPTSPTVLNPNNEKIISTQPNNQSSSIPPKSLFQYLVNYLEVTPNQAAALKDSRHVAKELDSALAQSLTMLEELRERLTQCTDDLDAEFTQIRSILTPRQAAKFLVWVANNGACMHMLNELWSRQYPEPVVKDEIDIISNNCDDQSANHAKKDGIRSGSCKPR